MNELIKAFASAECQQKHLLAAEVAGYTRSKEEPTTPARSRAL